MGSLVPLQAGGSKVPCSIFHFRLGRFQAQPVLVGPRSAPWWGRRTPRAGAGSCGSRTRPSPWRTRGPSSRGPGPRASRRLLGAGGAAGGWKVKPEVNMEPSTETNKERRQEIIYRKFTGYMFGKLHACQGSSKSGKSEVGTGTHVSFRGPFAWGVSPRSPAISSDSHQTHLPLQVGWTQLGVDGWARGRGRTVRLRIIILPLEKKEKRINTNKKQSPQEKPTFGVMSQTPLCEGATTPPGNPTWLC